MYIYVYTYVYFIVIHDTYYIIRIMYKFNMHVLVFYIYIIFILRLVSKINLSLQFDANNKKTISDQTSFIGNDTILMMTIIALSLLIPYMYIIDYKLNIHTYINRYIYIM